MNKKLSQNTQQGFTLVELMVVIAIIAILAVVGLTLFSGLQKGARDSRRQQDIDAIAKALETHYQSTGGNCQGGLTTATTVPGYCSVENAWFAGSGGVPTDPNGGSYCIWTGTTTPPDPTAPSTGGVVATCPNSGVTIADTTSSVTTYAAWTICAFYENTGGQVCQHNQQQ